MPGAKGWVQTKLGTVATFSNGGAWNASEYVESGIPVVRVTDCQNGTVDVSACKYLSEAAYAKYRKHEIAEGDLIVATVGSHPTQPGSVVGRPIVVPREVSGALLNQNAVCIRPVDNSTLDKRFLSHFAKAPSFGEYIISCARGSANQVRMAIGLLKEMSIALPPLPTQRKIAAILSAYDDLIENNLRRIKILEEMAQNLYREWFVKFRFPGHQHARFTDSPLGRIPEGWECGVVNDLLSLKSGFAFKSSIFTKDGTYGLVTIKNVHDGLFVPDCTSRIADLPSNMPSFCHLSTGDVLLSLTGNIGRVCLVYGTDYLLNQRVAKLVANEANNRAYIYFTFRQDEFQTKLSKIANGVAQQNLSPIETGRMRVVLPSQKVLADFAGVCEPIVEQMTALFQKNTILSRTRDLLLPKLISGEVDVSDLDIAVPEEAEA